jgi:hypothetical protein
MSIQFGTSAVLLVCWGAVCVTGWIALLTGRDRDRWKRLAQDALDGEHKAVLRSQQHLNTAKAWIDAWKAYRDELAARRAECAALRDEVERQHELRDTERDAKRVAERGLKRAVEYRTYLRHQVERIQADNTSLRIRTYEAQTLSAARGRHLDRFAAENKRLRARKSRK